MFHEGLKKNRFHTNRLKFEQADIKGFANLKQNNNRI